jgi:hypothetical protein
MKVTSTQSSVVRNRSTMLLSRPTISGKRATTRPQPNSRVLCTVTSKTRPTRTRPRARLRAWDKLLWALVLNSLHHVYERAA